MFSVVDLTVFTVILRLVVAFGGKVISSPTPAFGSSLKFRVEPSEKVRAPEVIWSFSFGRS